jgi:hypothetical protein
MKNSSQRQKVREKEKKEQNLSFFDRQISVSPIAIGLCTHQHKRHKNELKCAYVP